MRRGADDGPEMISARGLARNSLFGDVRAIARRPITASAFRGDCRGRGALARPLAAAWATVGDRQVWNGPWAQKGREPPRVHRGPMRRRPGLAGGSRAHGAHPEAPPRPKNSKVTNLVRLILG